MSWYNQLSMSVRLCLIHRKNRSANSFKVESVPGREHTVYFSCEATFTETVCAASMKGHFFLPFSIFQSKQ